MVYIDDLKTNRYRTVFRDVEFKDCEIIVDLKNDMMVRYGSLNNGERFVDLDGGPFIYITEKVDVSGEKFEIEEFVTDKRKLFIKLKKLE